MPTLRAVAQACSAAALVVAAACADSTSARVQPVPGDPGSAAVRLVCLAEVAKGTVRCAEPGAPAGIRADRILGQYEGVKLTSSNAAVVADTFAFDMAVTSAFEYPIGTTDGVNPDPAGIRVFFVDGVHTTSGTGSVTVTNADGVGTFTATGQPYFAYVGVLAPGATTAPRRWKLRFDPGVETFTFGMYVSTPVPPGGGTVALTVLDPAANTVVGDSVVIRARIDSSPASVQSVKAYAGDKVVTLLPYAPGLVRGTLHVAGLPFGPVPIRVHAVTVRADTGNAFVTIRKDSPPTLVIAAPVWYTVARPNLRVDIDCVDDDPAGCTFLRLHWGGVTFATGTTGIHTDVSLAAYDEQRLVLEYYVQDSGGHTLSAYLPVLVESRSTLAFVDSAGSNAMDVDSSRLLFSDAATTAYVRDRVTGTRTVVHGNVFSGSPRGWLLPQGAMVSREPSGGLYEWRNGAIVPLAHDQVYSAALKGNWVAWNFVNEVRRRDLTTGAIMLMVDRVDWGNGEVELAANGDLVYNWQGKIKRYRDGVVTDVTTSGNSSGPVTDGVSIVYLKDRMVTMWNGAGETVLSNILPADAARYTHYAVNDGWIAYVVVDGGGQTQVRTRAPDGTVRQATSLGSGSQLRALSADGTLVFASAGMQYVVRAPYSAAPVLLGPDWFRATFRGTELLLFLGNTVFRASY